MGFGSAAALRISNVMAHNPGRFLIVSAAVSNIGDGIQFSALPLLAYSISEDPLFTASVATARVLPVVVFALPVSAWLERFPPTLVMQTSLGIRAIGATALSVLIATHSVPILVLLLLTAVLGICDAAFDTTSSAAVVDVVVEESRHKYNGALSFIQTFGVGLLGPLLGAALFTMSAAAPFVTNAAMLAVAAIILLRGFGSAGLRSFGDATQDESFARRIVTGIAVAVGSPLLRSLVILSAAWNLLGWIPEGVLVIFVRTDLHQSDFIYSVVLVTSALGSLAGAWVARFFGDRLDPRYILALATPLYGLLFIPVAFLDSWVVISILFFVQGLPLMIWSIAVTTLRQNLVPRHQLVRVNSVFYLMAVGLAPVGLMIGPVIAHFVSVRGTFVAAGVLLIIASTPGFMILRQGPLLTSRVGTA